MTQSVDKLGIMQPYFLPYIGYWQLLSNVDTFVIYDNIEYTKKGWFNRNRYLSNGQSAIFTLHLRKAPDTAHICDREVSSEFNRAKMIAQFREAYRKAPFLDETLALLVSVVECQESNAFRFLHSSIVAVRNHLSINTTIVVSSTIPIDHHILRGQDKVLALCRHFGAKEYFNSIGGLDIYNRETFRNAGTNLVFMKAHQITYTQLKNSFVPSLSIIDVLMFNGVEGTKKLMNRFTLE